MAAASSASPASNTNNDRPPFGPRKRPSTIEFDETLPWSATDDESVNPWRRPELNIRAHDFLGKTHEQMRTLFEDDGCTAGLIIVHAFSSLPRLMRFVDRRQTKLAEKPRPDGKNLVPIGRWPRPGEGTPLVKIVYDVYVRWLTFLHYDTLVQFPLCSSRKQAVKYLDRSRLDEFYRFFAHIPRKLLELEKKGLGSRPEPEPGFEWIWKLKEILYDALASMLAARRWSATNRVDLREGETEAWYCIPPMARLLLLLLSKEDEFEFSLTCDHVEDIAYDKRVIIVSPEEALLCGRARLKEIINEFGPPLREAMGTMQHELRQLYDFRLLRDWGYGRPWKKLFILFDTAADKIHTDKLGFRPLSACITELQDYLKSSPKASDIFDVHPMDAETHDRENSCTICMSNFESDAFMMQLWCSHFFHPYCIFEYWDVDNRYIYTCPNCRHSPTPLRDRVVFPAEKTDFDVTDNGMAMFYDQIDAEMSHALARGVRRRYLPVGYQVHIMRRELSKLNAKRREEEKENTDRGFLPLVE